MSKILWCVDISAAKPDRILYRGWQLELFLYSMVKGGVPEEDICVTHYSEDPSFDPPTYFSKIFSFYPKLKVSHDIDVGFSPLYHTMDRGIADYCAINKSSALISVYKNNFHQGYETIALLDLDAYMFGKANYEVYPTTTTLTKYPAADPVKFCKVTSGLQGQERLTNEFKDIWGNPWSGINLIKVMESINVPPANIEKVKAGSYNIFIGSEDFTEEVVFGFQYFTIAIKALCAAAGHPFVWQAEMGAYPLTLASYGVDYELSDNVEINDCPYHRDDIPEGTICTYAFDGFSQSSGSKFNKLQYMQTTPFDDDYLIAEGLNYSNSKAERAFYTHCLEIKNNYKFKREEL